MRNNNARSDWDQISGTESDEDYDLFVQFLRLPKPRSIESLAKEQGKKVRSLFVKMAWDARSKSYDEEESSKATSIDNETLSLNERSKARSKAYLLNVLEKSIIRYKKKLDEDEKFVPKVSEIKTLAEIVKVFDDYKDEALD